MGKSLYIHRLAQKLLTNLHQPDVVHVTIPLHGPNVTPDTVLGIFTDKSLTKSNCCIYHIDIAPDVSYCTELSMYSKRKVLNV